MNGNVQGPTRQLNEAIVEGQGLQPESLGGGRAEVGGNGVVVGGGAPQQQASYFEEAAVPAAHQAPATTTKTTTEDTPVEAAKMQAASTMAATRREAEASAQPATQAPLATPKPPAVPAPGAPVIATAQPAQQEAAEEPQPADIQPDALIGDDDFWDPESWEEPASEREKRAAKAERDKYQARTEADVRARIALRESFVPSVTMADLEASTRIRPASENVKESTLSEIESKGFAPKGIAASDTLVADKDASIETVVVGMEIISSMYERGGWEITSILDKGLGKTKAEFASEEEWQAAAIEYINRRAEGRKPIWLQVSKTPITERSSVQARPLKVRMGRGIAVNPMSAKQFDADFDGDESHISFANTYRDALARSIDPRVAIKDGAVTLDFDSFVINYGKQGEENIDEIAKKVADYLVSDKCKYSRIFKNLDKSDVMDLSKAYVEMCVLGIDPKNKKRDVNFIYLVNDKALMIADKYAAKNNGEHEMFTWADEFSVASSIMSGMQDAGFNVVNVERIHSLPDQAASYDTMVDEIRTRFPDGGISDADYATKVVATIGEAWRRAKVPADYVSFVKALHACGVFSSEGNPQFRLKAEIAKNIKIGGIVVNGYVELDENALPKIYNYMAKPVFARAMSGVARDGAIEETEKQFIARHVKERLGEDFFYENIISEQVPANRKKAADMLVEAYNDAAELAHGSKTRTLMDGTTKSWTFTKLKKFKTVKDGLKTTDISEILVEVWGDEPMSRMFPDGVIVDYMQPSKLIPKRAIERADRRGETVSFSKGYLYPYQTENASERPAIEYIAKFMTIEEYFKNNSVSSSMSNSSGAKGKGGGKNPLSRTFNETIVADGNARYQTDRGKKEPGRETKDSLVMDILICGCDMKTADAAKYMKGLTSALMNAREAIRNISAHAGGAKTLEDIDAHVMRELELAVSLMYDMFPKIMRRMNVETVEDFLSTDIGKTIWNASLNLSEAEYKKVVIGAYVEELIKYGAASGFMKNNRSRLWSRTVAGFRDSARWDVFMSLKKDSEILQGLTRKKSVDTSSLDHANIIELIMDENVPIDDRLAILSDYHFYFSGGDSLTKDQVVMELASSGNRDNITIDALTFEESPISAMWDASNKLESLVNKLKAEDAAREFFLERIDDPGYLESVLDVCADHLSYTEIPDTVYYSYLDSIHGPAYKTSEKTGKNPEVDAYSRIVFDMYGGMTTELDDVTDIALGRISARRITPRYIAMALADPDFSLEVVDENGFPTDRTLSREGLTGGRTVDDVRKWLKTDEGKHYIPVLRGQTAGFSSPDKSVKPDPIISAKDFSDYPPSKVRGNERVLKQLRCDADWSAFTLMFSPAAENNGAESRIETYDKAERAMLSWIIRYAEATDEQRVSMMDEMVEKIESVVSGMSITEDDVIDPEEFSSYKFSELFRSMVVRTVPMINSTDGVKSPRTDMFLDVSEYSVMQCAEAFSTMSSASIPFATQMEGTMSDEMFMSGIMFESVIDFYKEGDSEDSIEINDDYDAVTSTTGALNKQLSIMRWMSAEAHNLKKAKRAVSNAVSLLGKNSGKYGFQRMKEEWESVKSNMEGVYVPGDPESRIEMDRILGRYIQRIMKSLDYNDFSLATCASIAHFMIKETESGFYVRSLRQIDSAIDSAVANNMESIDSMSLGQVATMCVDASDLIDGSVTRSLSEAISGVRFPTVRQITAYGTDMYLSQEQMIRGTAEKFFNDFGKDRSMSFRTGSTAFDLKAKPMSGESVKDISEAVESKAVEAISRSVMDRTRDSMIGFSHEDGVFLPNENGKLTNFAEEYKAPKEGEKEQERKTAIAPIGFRNTFVIGNNTNPESVMNIVQLAKRSGWRLLYDEDNEAIASFFDGKTEYQKYVQHGFMNSGHSWRFIDFFEYEMVGGTSVESGWGHIDESQIVDTIEDAHPDMPIGDAYTVLTDEGYDNIGFNSTGTSSVSVYSLFKNTLTQDDGEVNLAGTSKDVKLCDEADIDAISEFCNRSEEELFLYGTSGLDSICLDTNVSESSPVYREYRKAVYNALKRYKKNVLENDGIARGEYKAGDIVGFAKMEIMRDDAKVVVYSPIFAWIDVKGQSGNAPSRFTIDSDKASYNQETQSFDFSWSMSDNQDGATVKLHSAYNPANKTMIRVEKTGVSYMFEDGSHAHFVTAATTVSGRTYNTRSVDMQSVMYQAMKGRHAFNIAELDGFVGDDQLKEIMANEFLPVDSPNATYTWKQISQSKMRLFADDEMNDFAHDLIEKCLEVEVNPSFMFQTRLSTEGGYAYPCIKFDFELVVDPSLRFFDKFLKFYYMCTLENGVSLVPNGIDGSHEMSVYRVIKPTDPETSGNPLHEYTLYRRVDRGNGKMDWEHVVTDMSFFGTDFSGMKRPRLNQSIIHPQSIDAMTQAGAVLNGGNPVDKDMAKAVKEKIKWGTRQKTSRRANRRDIIIDGSDATVSYSARPQIIADKRPFLMFNAKHTFEVNGDMVEKTLGAMFLETKAKMSRTGKYDSDDSLSRSAWDEVLSNAFANDDTFFDDVMAMDSEVVSLRVKASGDNSVVSVGDPYVDSVNDLIRLMAS